jgi:UDP-GlcNAc:undecaprenyl-phosphate GlcNAc-1-phosphate transferase
VVLGHAYGSHVAVLAAAALAGSLAAFLRFNLPPARIFLGDAGALGIGYTTAVVSLASYQRSPAAVVLIVPLVVLGLPLVDTLLAVVRRGLNHVRSRGPQGLRPTSLVRAIASADRGHIHHILLRSGWSIRRILFTLYVLSAALGVLALWTRSLTPEARWALWLVLAGGATAGLYVVERRLSAREPAPAPGAREVEPAAGRRATG